MKLNIKKGKKVVPIRLVAYGPEGIGKSTFASQFPEPLFLDLENGTTQLDVFRAEPETGPWTWTALTSAIDEVAKDPSTCKTLVIDTLDRAEALLVEDMLKKSGHNSIEDYGYGKGYTILQERFFKEFLGRLDTVIGAGVNVTLLAHAATRKYESPEDPPYDRWELKLSKKVAPIVKEWSDILIFMNFEQKVETVDKDGKKGKAVGKAKRRMHAAHRPTYDAKNRYGLPDDMDLSFEPLRSIYERPTVPAMSPTMLNVDTPTPVPVEDPGEDPREYLLRQLASAGISKSKFEAWLVATGRLAPGSYAEHLSGTAVDSMLKNIDKLIEVIGGSK